MKNNLKTIQYLAGFILAVILVVQVLSALQTPAASAAGMPFNSWDGWIKLGGNWTNSTVVNPVPDSNGKHHFSGFGFGAQAVEWVDFSSKDCDKDSNGFVDTGSCRGDNSSKIVYPYSVWTTVSGLFPNPPSVWLRATSNLVTRGTSATIFWSSDNVDVGNSCLASGGAGAGWSGPKAANDTFTTLPLSDTTNFSILCRNSVISKDAYDNLTVYVCGNGVVEAAGGEKCDDGNIKNGDGCSAMCSNVGVDATGPAKCGNAICEVSSGENIRNCAVDCTRNIKYQEI